VTSVLHVLEWVGIGGAVILVGLAVLFLAWIFNGDNPFL
jgi:hypothetical protein